MNNNGAYIITDSILNSIANIMQELGKLDNYKNTLLDRRILERSIKASVKMEDNDDSMDVKYYRMHDYLDSVDYIDESIIKKLYSMLGSNDKIYRSSELDGNSIQSLTNNLIQWLNTYKGKTHPLLLAIVFHYWFMNIKPFNNYNGIIARVLLEKELINFNSTFNMISINEYLLVQQDDYECMLNENVNDFIEFMLDIIYKALHSIEKKSNQYDENIINVNKLLSIMEVNKPMTAYEIMERLNIKSKETLRNSYLNYAIKNKLVRLTNPSKPTSRNQMYYKV